MKNYMRALHLRFKNSSQRSQELEREATTLHRRLSSRLAKQERKLLLKLIDLEDTLRNQTSLDGFVSGFRLADGIHRELMEQPPYSFYQEEERRSCKSSEKGGIKHGKTQTVRRRHGTQT